MIRGHVQRGVGGHIPYYLDFNPGIVLVPIVSVFWGPAGVLGCVAASLIGDVLLGLWGPLSFFRAVGCFLFALSAKRLWDTYPHRLGEKESHSPAWRATFRFIFISWPGCFIAAAWVGMGSEITRAYPFYYIAFLQLTHHLLFVTILGVALYRIFAREIVPHFGTWRDAIKKEEIPGCLSHKGAVLLVIGSFGSIIAGFVFGKIAQGACPWQALSTGQVIALGTINGSLFPLVVAPFLALQMVGIFGERINAIIDPCDRTDPHHCGNRH